MSRYNSGSHRDPYLIQFDRHSEMSALHEAKLAAWAFAIGEDGPFSEMPGRRPHRGMLPDLPAPEPPRPGKRRRTLLGRLADAIGRVLQPAWASEAHAAMLLEDTLDAGRAGPDIASIGRTRDIASAARRATDDAQPARSRAA